MSLTVLVDKDLSMELQNLLQADQMDAFVYGTQDKMLQWYHLNQLPLKQSSQIVGPLLSVMLTTLKKDASLPVMIMVISKSLTYVQTASDGTLMSKMVFADFNLIDLTLPKTSL